MPAAMRDQLIARAMHDAPFEMVGLFGGHGSHIEAFVPSNNHSPTPRVAFYVEPDVEEKLHSILRDRGHSVLGVYHSHLTTEAKPSQADLRMCRKHWLMIIVNPFRDQLRCFDEQGTEIAVELTGVIPLAEDLPDVLEEDSVL